MTKPINDRIAELYKDVFYFALSRIDNYRDAEDIAQVVMEKALKKTYMLRNEDKLKSWVMRITSNEINMYFRKVKKINSILFNIEEVFDGDQDIDFGIAGLEKDVLQHITGKTDEMNICRALERIDDKYQIVLQLHLVCEFDFAKTAEILNVNINSVKTRYYRGLRVLKKSFSSWRTEVQRMEQMTKAEIHSELCRKMQSARDTYCRNTCTAPEINIDRLIKYKRKQTIKRVSGVAAVFLVFIITSVFFAQEFFSDNGYGKYIVQKSVSSMSPLDITTERLGNGEPLSVVNIDDEVQLDKFNEFMGRELVLGYMPEGYEFKCGKGYKANNFYIVLYQYKAGDIYMDIDVEDIDYNNGKMHIRGEFVKTLDNGDKIYGENPDEGTYTVTRIINDDIFVVIDGDGSYEEAMRVVENVSIE